ncbi:nucleotidyltransferase domain-containing protein [Candidatus Woesearchaeota archaeon]|nr:nucleotidyltransferase domain-containing protein [Candidatus Woesearchaeota archaeon]
MLTQCEQRIMEVLLPQPFKAYSVRQLSKLIKNSYALTHKSVNSLITRKMAAGNKVGNSIACRLSLAGSAQLLAATSLTYTNKYLSNAKFGFIIDEIKDKLSTSIYIMILFGSHAKKTAEKSSDVDVLFVVQNEKDIEKVRKDVRAILSSTAIKFEFEVITSEWLLKMFDERNSVGREALEASIILHGAEQYYTLVKHYDKTRGYKESY